VLAGIAKRRFNLWWIGCVNCFGKLNYSATDEDCRLFTTFMVEQSRCTEESIVQRYGDRLSPRLSPASVDGHSPVTDFIATDESMESPATKRPRQDISICSSSSASSAVSPSIILQYLDRPMTVSEKFKIDSAIAHYIRLHGEILSPFHNEERMVVLKLLQKSYMDAGGPPTMEQVSTKFLNSHLLQSDGIGIVNYCEKLCCRSRI